MRAVVPVDTGRIGFADVDDVRPSADEMVIEVAAFSINRGETFQLERPQDGWRPGKDIAGRVIEATLTVRRSAPAWSLISHTRAGPSA